MIICEGEIECRRHPDCKRFVDLTGRRIHRLLVLGYAGFINNHSWYCKCDCGVIKIIQGQRLRSGKQRSCGCLFAENQVKKMTIHGHRRNGGKHKSDEYGCWSSARDRCVNPNHKAYSRYGGRGIQMRFETFTGFLEHIGPRPTSSHSLDRINNNGHYEPGNVRWATWREQGCNKRNNVLAEVNGAKKPLCFLIHEAIPNCDQETMNRVSARIGYGWCFDCATTKKLGGTCVHKTKK